MATRHSMALELVKGALAGAAATWLMNQATTWMYSLESDEAKDRENRARGGGSAYENAADMGANLVGLELSEQQRGTAATAIHYGTGITAGMLYAATRRRQPEITAGKGLLFGMAWFLAVDELMNAALGLTPGPDEFPWQAHARGLGGHLTFGFANELILEGLDRVA